MTYRKATIEDINKLAILFNDYRVFYRKEENKEKAKVFLSERINNNDSKIFVAESETQELTGFVQLYPLFSSTRMEKLWLLNDLFVNPDFRNKGISVGLIEMAKELVKETKACGMFLETEKTNIVGNNLYPKTGFALNEGSNFYDWNPT